MKLAGTRRDSPIAALLVIGSVSCGSGDGRPSTIEAAAHSAAESPKATASPTAIPTDSDPIAITPGSCVFSVNPFDDATTAHGQRRFVSGKDTRIFATCLWMESWGELEARTNEATGATLLGQSAKLGVDGAYPSVADDPTSFALHPSPKTRASSYRLLPPDDAAKLAAMHFWERGTAGPGEHKVCLAVTILGSSQAAPDPAARIRRVANGCFQWVVPD